MPHASLADFLEELASRGELARIAVEVDPALEIAEITRRVAQDGGPALLFDRVRGQSMSVVTNLLGTEDRVCRALGVEALDDLVERTADLVEKYTPRNWFDRLKTSGDEAGANKLRAKCVKSGPCQQVVRLGRDVDLGGLPLTKQWPAESGPSITAGQLISRNRAGEVHGSTICPLVACGADRLAVVDDGHSALARHWAEHLAAGDKMPVAIVLGGDPACLAAAHVETATGSDAYHHAGLVRGKPLELVKCKSHTIEVPADADLIFEGYLDPETAPTSAASAGAGGSHYREAQPGAVVHVTAITHRNRPLFPVIIDSPRGGETGALAKLRERLLLAALGAVAPDVVDLHLPGLGGAQRWAFVAIQKRYPFHARQIAAALWGTPALGFTKFLVLVDAGVNLRDVGRVLAEVGANVAPERDLFSLDAPAHGSDHANTLAPLSRRLAIDATAKTAAEHTAGKWPAALAVSDETRKLVTARWAEYAIELPGRPQ